MPKKLVAQITVEDGYTRYLLSCDFENQDDLKAFLISIGIRTYHIGFITSVTEITFSK